MDGQRFSKLSGFLKFALFLAACISLVLWFLTPEYRNTLIVVLVVVLIYRFIRLFIIEPIDEKTLNPIQQISDLKEGSVTIQGKIIPINYLKAPFSKEKCVAFIFEADNVPANQIDLNIGMVDATDGLYYSKLISTPFKIKDETGTVLIEPTGLNLSDINELITEDDQLYATEYVLLPHQEYTLTGNARKELGQWVIAQDEKAPNDFTIKLNENTKTETDKSFTLLFRPAVNFGLFLFCLILFIESIPYDFSNGQLEIFYKSSYIYQFLSQNLSTPLNFLGNQDSWNIPFGLWGKSELLAEMPMGALFFYLAYSFFFIVPLAWITKKLMPKIVSNVFKTYSVGVLMSLPFIFFMILPMIIMELPPIHIWIAVFLFIIGYALFALTHSWLLKEKPEVIE